MAPSLPAGCGGLILLPSSLLQGIVSLRDGAGRVREGWSEVGATPAGGCRVGGEAFPGLSPVLSPHPAPSGSQGSGSPRGRDKNRLPGLPVWAGLWRGEEEEEGGEEPAGSAVCSARISRLLWLSPLLFRPLRQARRAAVGSMGRRSPLGCRHGSRQLAPSSALKWTCKRQNTCRRAWRTEAWLTGLFKSTAWPPTGQPSCGGVTRRRTPGVTRGDEGK